MQELALVTIGKEGDRPVLFGTCHAARVRFAGEQSSLVIKSQTVQTTGVFPKDGKFAAVGLRFPVGNVPTVDCSTFHIREKQETDAAEDGAGS